MRRNTWALVALAALALVTVVLVLLSFLHVRPSKVAAEPLQSSAVAKVEDGASPLSSLAPSPSPTPTRAPRESTVANIKQSLTGQEPMKILVLGDASGRDSDGPDGARWVTLWGQHLAAQRPVTVAVRGGDGKYAEPRRFGPETGAPIEILNASDAPGTLAEATAQADTLLPADVDLVIISFGHREGAAPIRSSLDALWAKLPPGAMGLVVAQNPERTDAASAQRDRAHAVMGWAQQKHVHSVDVFYAFIAAPEPLVQLLTQDRILPNNRGSELWRDAVVAALA